jgi:PAS domain S-box-containing protein
VFWGVIRDFMNEHRTDKACEKTTAPKEKDDLLKAQEQLLLVQASIDNTSESIFWIDKDANFINVNKSACKNLGYSKEEMLSMKVTDIAPHFPLEKWPANWNELKKRGSMVFETHHKHKNGKEHPVEVKLNYVEFGGKEYNFAFARDITERKRAEDILRSIAEKISVEIGESFFQSMVTFIAQTFDIKYAFLGELMDEKPDTIKTIAVYSDGKIVDNFEYALADTPCRNVMAGSLCSYPDNVQKLFPKDYMLRDMGVESYIGAPLADSHKKTIGLLVILDTNPLQNEDMIRSMFQIFALRASSEIERKRSEEVFRESEARFRAIFERSPFGISIANNKGKIIDSNPALQKMLGYTKAELTQKFSELTYPEDISKNIHLFEEMVAGRRDHYWLEKRYYHKDGSIVWANLMVTAIRGRNKEFKYNFAIVENITERKKLEDQLRHAQKMEAVGQLAGGVAHDFNNILTAIIGYASLLKLKLKGNEQVMHNVNQIISITERGAGLTQSLLAFSRKQDLSLKPIKLNDLMERVMKLIPRIIGEEIEFRKILSDVKMMVMADSSQLEQVLMNLAGNARDAMQDDGVLTIETEYVMLDLNYVKMQGFGSPGPYALISVSDTGIGIEPETIGKIFEPFFTTKEVGEGTGLGLSLVYGIIKQHNGYVNVYSEPDHGATFKIYLPLIGEVNTEHEHMEDESIIGGTETILLAEDETEVREVIKELLHEYGFSVVDAVNGKDAVDKYSENKDNIDLLLMDVVMPKMNGKEAYDAIKKITPGIKALFTSGYTSKKVNTQGVLQEGIPYIAKPVNPRTLLKKIREVLDES